ncbi:MAG: hypothetical protein UT91_C0011G0012 [Parcubacteria group bacterium GW2011_GWA2_40_23]|nr:MAG: hypothetical protein UT91_C0011G0012 [Parcubacteria group bacterium GW2011_GWA2_40_23]
MSMSAPTLSQTLAISLMKDIFVAKKAFDAYLISSDEGTVVSIFGQASFSMPRRMLQYNI